MIDTSGMALDGKFLMEERTLLPLRGIKDGEEYVYHWMEHPVLHDTLLVSTELLAQIKDIASDEHTLSTGE